MDSTVIVAVLSLVGTLGGTFAGIMTSTKLSNYRIEQLEHKVELHNKVVERTFKIEGDIKTLQAEIDDIKDDVHTLKTN